MKILILANPDSVHTINWVNALCDIGIEIYLFGLNNFDANKFHQNAKIESLDISSKITDKSDASLHKVIYFVSLKKIKEIIKKVKPDILHAHYASSYGLLGALSNYHPYIISVWGSDIYYVPTKNIIQKKLIKYSLSKADLILSTSLSLKKQVNKYTDKEIIVTPFGIDTNKFKKYNSISYFDKNDIVVGTVKALEERYGIENLIRTFRLVKDKLPSIPLKLLIVGRGTQEKYLKKIVKELKLEEDTLFTGFVPPDKIPDYHNMIDIFVALSIENESFGVAVLEALACEKPVIVSNVDGFVEIVQNNKTGIIVEKKDVQNTAEAITKLIMNKKLREQMGITGRQFIIENYGWEKSVNQMLNIYQDINPG